MRGIGRLEAWLAGTKAATHVEAVGAGVVPREDDRRLHPWHHPRRDQRQGPRRHARCRRRRWPTRSTTAAVTAGHVDAVTKATKSLDADQRTELLDRLDRGSARRGRRRHDRRVAAPAGDGGQEHPARRRHRPARAPAAGDEPAHLDRRRGHVVPVGPVRSGHRRQAGRRARHGGQHVVRRADAEHVPHRPDRQATPPERAGTRRAGRRRRWSAAGRADPSTWSWSTAHNPTAPVGRRSTGGSRSRCHTGYSPN